MRRFLLIAVLAAVGLRWRNISGGLSLCVRC